MNAVGNILQSQNVRVLDMTANFPVFVLGLATRPNSHIWNIDPWQMSTSLQSRRTRDGLEK